MRGGGRGVALPPIKTSADDERWMTEEPLSPGARVFHEPRMNCCVLAALGSQTPIDVEIIKKGLKENLIKHPRFCSNFVNDVKRSGKKTWVRTQVDLDDHIVIPDVNLNMDSPDRFVEDYISNLTTTQMDMSKPLWELHLLNIKTSEAEAVFVFKIHHSLGDGISLISVLLACARKTSDPNSLPSLPLKKEVATPCDQSGISRHLAALHLLCMSLWNTFIAMVLFLATAFFLKDTETPIKGGPATGKSRKRIVHQILDLDDIKFVKKEMNMTINDVLFGITQAGLSRYLNRRYGNINRLHGMERKDNLPKSIRLRATLLMNVRPAIGIQESAKLMEKEIISSMGNSIAYVILPFHIASVDDPLDHIHHAKAIIDKKKQSLEAKCTYASGHLLFRLLGEKAIAALSFNIIAHTTLSFSNVVGPVEDISLYGHPISYIAPTVYGHPQLSATVALHFRGGTKVASSIQLVWEPRQLHLGTVQCEALTVHFQSYTNKMSVVLAVDEDIIPDPRTLSNDIATSLAQIKIALSEG